NRKGTVMVCDNNFHLIGVLSDGEIRRALTSGKNILSPIKEIININPVFIKNEFNYQKTAKDIFRKKNNINMLPVIDGDNKLIDVIIRDCKS
ncbi:CBS domain-containing protein, partial [bacterium]|nr:CBS domain-containing protein [bacterium]